MRWTAVQRRAPQTTRQPPVALRIGADPNKQRMRDTIFEGEHREEVCTFNGLVVKQLKLVAISAFAGIGSKHGSAVTSSGHFIPEGFFASSAGGD